ncbi:MAG: hypothetical protein GY694_19255 [Gammaproteobacteria bacterium]|nr:hypothetical protein [Gammaproteobacteria bacterium]
MSITTQQRQIASLINDQVTQVISTKQTSSDEDDAIVELMPIWLDGFIIIMDTLPTQDFNLLCEEYPGFFRFSKTLEKRNE